MKRGTHFYCYRAEFACSLLIAKSIVIKIKETSRVVFRSLIDVRIVGIRNDTAFLGGTHVHADIPVKQKAFYMK